MKRNSDLDHPFYSDKAIRARKILIKRLEKEERELALENRRRYHSKKKGGEEPTDEDGNGNSA